MHGHLVYQQVTMASLEYRTLVRATPKMTDVISGGYSLTVAEKLSAKGLVAPSAVDQAQNIAIANKVKASSLVSTVTRNVGSFPENYEDFLQVLDDVPLKQLVKHIRTVYETIKAEDQVSIALATFFNQPAVVSF